MPGKTNGTSNGTPERSFINFDPDDPDYIKDLQRPAAIKEDLSEMERRKRVQQILESKSFCKTLEELIKQESENNKTDPEHLKTLQRLSELTLPHGHLAAVSLRSIGSASVLPVADLRGNDKYTKAEKLLRNKLASLYRLVDLFQWSQGIYNHITLRLSDDTDEILINPFGLLYHEITASSLVKVNLDGEILDHGSTKLGINQAGYVLHSAIHRARPDVRCVLHMHTAVVSAVSSMKCGLLPISQEAMIIGPVAYHDYQGILNEESERQSIIDDLGEKNVMLLRNHGFVACGESVEEALHLAFHTIIACESQACFFYSHFLQIIQILIMRTNGFIVCGETVEEAMYLTRSLISACDNQLRAARAGLENLVIPDEKAVERAYKTARRGGEILFVQKDHLFRKLLDDLKSPAKDANGRQINWRIGELEWEAWMRVLDNAGYRTGHLYRQPILSASSAASNVSAANQNDVAIPPSASAMGEVDETDAEALTAHKIALMRKEQERSRWLNSPNAYQRIEVLETGTDNPKKITKWVQDVTTPSNSGTAVKISSPHQFSPFGVNPKEFKEKQKAIKENRRLGATSAGPQSQILDGVTYEEAAQLRSEVAETSGQGDRVLMIGTASKGIIDRQHQHNAQVYRQLYAPNPFASETDEDIQKYMKEVESKTPRPGSVSETIERATTPSQPVYETDSPSAGEI
ncbi:unnamed protein product [Anisakis simplex]|uniref:Adducin-related protein 1 (inferred by orthology to a C. elegans protein) n=1 Tax=Anisakis simplex TaxID=6269 RepID=A0A0M3JZG7_ANISI|nr:unnamed protein product [Anisakis simplex]